MQTNVPTSTSPWPHRIAVSMVCATFPVIWVGGLVTTHKAGMAVIDWPNTFGYNLFLYPWTTWFTGPFDLFIEHGHRLLAGGVLGPVAIIFVVTVWRCNARRSLRWLAVAALVGVIFQGLLGGMRVRLDARTFAMLHACIGPAFFAFTVGLAAITSQGWQSSAAPVEHPLAGKLQRLAIATTLLAYLQLLLGAQLRHTPLDASSGFFRTALYFHLIVAAALLMHIVLSAKVAFRLRQQVRQVFAPAMLLLALVFGQILLGGLSWVVKYGWPVWFADYDWAAGHVVVAEGARSLTELVAVMMDRIRNGEFSFMEFIGLFGPYLVTAHVAVGSLILASSAWLSLRSLRFLQAVRSPTRASTHLALGVAV